MFKSLTDKNLWRNCFPLPLICLLVVYIVLRACYWAVPPIWDAQALYIYMLRAMQQPFNLLNYTSDGHICEGYLLLLSLPLRLFMKSYLAFNVEMSIFSTLSIIAFYHLLRLIRPHIKQWEAIFCTALFAFHPSVLANMIHFNLDQGLMTFFLLYWLFFWKEWRLAALFAGILMLTTKETSMLLLPLPFLFCLLKEPKEIRVQWCKRHYKALIVPYLVLAALLIYKYHIKGELFWTGISSQNNHKEIMLMNFMFMALAMNFQWFVAVLWGCCALQMWKRHMLFSFFTMEFLLALLFIATLMVCLIVRPWTNLRYLLVVFPVFLLSTFAWLPQSMPLRSGRLIIYTILGLLLSLENWRTVDPVSKAYFGTFLYSDHPMLDITSLSHECCVKHGRDQLVYNLEYLHIPETIMQIMQDTKPNNFTVFVYPQQAWFFTLFNLDRNDNPIFITPDIKPVSYATPVFLRLINPPEHIYYIDLPTMESEVGKLSKYYFYKKEKTYDIDGYKTIVYEFNVLKPMREWVPLSYGP